MKALHTLIVEDDAMIGGLLAETLEGIGHTVCTVESNVADAVASASYWLPDLMIVDVGLGEASGSSGGQRDPPKQIRPSCVRHRPCGERDTVGS